MKLRKKALAGFVATSLAVTALSGTGLVVGSPIGASVASAAVVTDANLLKLISFQTKIDALLAGNTSVTALKTALAGADHETAVAPLLAAFSGLSLTDDEKDALIELLTSISLPIASAVDVAALLQEEAVQSLVDKLESVSGIDITVEDFAAFFVVVNSIAYNTVLGNQTLTGSKTAIVESIAESALATSTAGAADAAALITYYFGDNAAFKAAVLETFYNYMDDTSVKTAFDSALPSIVAAFISANTVYSGGNDTTTTTTTSDSAAAAIKSLGDIKDKLANATDAEKADLIKQAVSAASAAIASSVSLDLSKSVAVSDGKATVKVDTAAVAGLLNDIKAIKEALADAIGSTSGLVIPPLAISLGDVDASSVTTSLPADVLKQLAEAGVPSANVSVNELTVEIPFDGDLSNGIDFEVGIDTPPPAIFAPTSTITPGSGVFTFAFTGFDPTDGVRFTVTGENGAGANLASDGQAAVLGSRLVDAGDEWKSALAASGGLDPELLTIASVGADGSLKIEGGTVDGWNVSTSGKQGTSYVLVENKVTFNDIASVQAWAGRQIEVVAARGAIEGKAAGQFAPTDSITRAEFAKILALALDIDNESATTSKFTDVSSSAWYAPYVAVAVEKGIINGRSATTFDPTATITRAEMATMIARALKSVKGIEGTDNANAALSAFSDANEINPSLKDGVAFAASKNIILGSAGEFKPNDNATRAEAAVIVYRTLGAK
ncbi:S-layer homology domain-containing protein [Cohnella fermenti]|nr:S-layer homology domain-containing protein [Cohnella fermenti]